MKNVEHEIIVVGVASGFDPDDPEACGCDCPVVHTVVAKDAQAAVSQVRQHYPQIKWKFLGGVSKVTPLGGVYFQFTAVGDHRECFLPQWFGGSF